MNSVYFDVKRQLKTIFHECMRAITKIDGKYTTYLSFRLDQVKKDLKDKDLDSFALYLLNKEVDRMKDYMNAKIKAEKNNEQNSRARNRK